MAATALLLLASLLLLAALWARARFAAFRAQSPEDYDGLAPAFDIRQHLSGDLVCEGVIYGPFGRVSSRFVADMTGTWQGSRGTLAERFRFDNGEIQDRTWHLEVAGDGRFTATADDVLGTGRGEQSGPAVRLRYRIVLPREAGGHVLGAIDWMYLIDGGTIINRSQFRKYGITVAELVATIRRKGSQ